MNKQLIEMIREEMGKRPEALFEILETLSEECSEIECHVRDNWQDKSTAGAWGKAQYYLDSASASIAPVLRSIGIRCKALQNGGLEMTLKQFEKMQDDVVDLVGSSLRCLRQASHASWDEEDSSLFIADLLDAVGMVRSAGNIQTPDKLTP